MTITNDLSNFGLMANAMYNSMTANATAITSMTVGIANSANLTTTTNVATIGTSAYFVANGNVGIGTASPTGKLHVVGGSKTDGVGTFLNGGGSEGGEINFLNPDNTTLGLVVDIAGTNNPRMFSSANNMAMQIGQLGSGTTNGSISLHTSSAERVRIDSSGNMGINQTSPTARLDVSGGIRALGGATYGTGVAGYSFSTNDTDGGMFSPADGTLVFATNNAERVRIDSSGNMGIGTTSPSVKLTVNGGISAFGDITSYRSASPTTGAYYFGNSGGNYLYYDGSNWTLSNQNTALFVHCYRINIGSGYAGEKQLYLQNTSRSVYYYLTSDGNVTGLWDANQSYSRWYSDINGTFIAPAFYASSDGRLKDNQVLIDNALNKLTELKGVTYVRTDLKNQDGSPVVDAGIIAQDLEKILPESVGSITQTPAQEPDPAIHYLTVNYNGVSALLVNAVKELNAKTDAALAVKDAEIEALKARLDALEKKLN